MPTYKIRASAKVRGASVAASLSLSLVVFSMVLWAAPFQADGREPDNFSFSSALTAYRQGMKLLHDGKMKLGMQALEFAAQGGIIGAQLKLARLYSKGQDIVRDDRKAFQYYRIIADRYAETNPGHPMAAIAAEAFISLADYYHQGVPKMGLKADHREALSLYRYAASYFRNPLAQFNLAQMYLAGHGVEKNRHIATKWLLNAAKKNHAASQALLGNMLWQGDGAPKRPLRALALLSFALENADANERSWIETIHSRIFASATEGQLEQTTGIVALWRTRYRLGKPAHSRAGGKGGERGKGNGMIPEISLQQEEADSQSSSEAMEQRVTVEPPVSSGTANVLVPSEDRAPPAVSLGAMSDFGGSPSKHGGGFRNIESLSVGDPP